MVSNWIHRRPFHKALNKMCVPQSEVSQRQHTKAQEEMSDRGRKNREEQQARFCRTSNCATISPEKAMRGEMLAVRMGCQVWEFGRLTV